MSYKQTEFLDAYRLLSFDKESPRPYAPPVSLTLTVGHAEAFAVPGHASLKRGIELAVEREEFPC